MEKEAFWKSCCCPDKSFHHLAFNYINLVPNSAVVYDWSFICTVGICRRLVLFWLSVGFVHMGALAFGFLFSDQLWRCRVLFPPKPAFWRHPAVCTVLAACFSLRLCSIGFSVTIWKHFRGADQHGLVGFVCRIWAVCCSDMASYLKTSGVRLLSDRISV